MVVTTGFVWFLRNGEKAPGKLFNARKTIQLYGLPEADVLAGKDIVPGFELAVREIFQ